MENNLIDDILKKYNILENDIIKNKLDSLNILNLIMSIEEAFNVKINYLDLKKNNTVKKIINEFVNNK
jgi:acyl carrier protein